MTNHEKSKLHNMLKLVNGFGKIYIKQFVENLSSFRRFYNTFPIIHKNMCKEEIQHKRLLNISIVFTGIRNKQLERFIENGGGHVKTSISKNTDILIYDGEQISNKIKRAKELGIKILSIEKFKSKYNYC